MHPHHKYIHPLTIQFQFIMSDDDSWACTEVVSDEELGGFQLGGSFVDPVSDLRMELKSLKMLLMGAQKTIVEQGAQLDRLTVWRDSIGKHENHGVGHKRGHISVRQSTVIAAFLHSQKCRDPQALKALEDMLLEIALS